MIIDMNSKTNFQKYICVDPSFFTSTKRLDSLPSVLRELKNDDSKIVIPSFLRPLFDIDEHKNNLDDVNTERLVDVNPEILDFLHDWNPSFNKKTNDNFQSLRQRIKDFAETFFSNLAFSEELTDEILEDGREPPISKQHIIKRLGKKGKTIFEFMMIGTKNGIIASYGRKLISFIRKIRMSTSEGFSNLKHKMIASGRAPELLKIVAFVFTATALNDFITGFEIMNMPFIGENEVIESGLGIIANGNG